MENIRVSIVVRTKNEEKWIGYCLEAIRNQETSIKFRNGHLIFLQIEVIVVDNESSDRTLDIVEKFDTKIISIKEFRPGLALNMGVKHSKGDYIVFLSGHCVPKNDIWLINLVRNFFNENGEKNFSIAGCYGKQEPLSYTSPRDKRDLLTLFGTEKIVQESNPFFHNANSAISKKLWEVIKFNENATNVEDRIWAKEVFALQKNLKIVYEPESIVWHWHGINHDSDFKRAESVVRVLENHNIYELDYLEEFSQSVDVQEALIPVREVELKSKKNLKYNFDILESVITGLIEFTAIPKIVFLSETDFKSNNEFMECVSRCAQNTGTSREKLLEKIEIFVRNKEETWDFQDVFQVVQEYFFASRNKMKKSKFLFLNLNYPNRNWLDIKNCIDFAQKNNEVDAVIPVSEVTHSIIQSSEIKTSIENYGERNYFNLIDRKPKSIEENRIYTVHYGYGSILSEIYLINKNVFSVKIYPFIIKNVLSLIEKSPIHEEIRTER